MSVETAAERKRKRIVEHILGPFDNAWEATRFGNTVESLVNDQVGKIKFRQSIGSPDTKLAITANYMGRTVLKTIFLEVPDNEAANFICKIMGIAIGEHNKEYAGEVTVFDEIVRDKPQPQFIGHPRAKQFIGGSHG